MIKILYSPMLNADRKNLIEYCLNKTKIDESNFVYFVPTAELQNRIEAEVAVNYVTKGISAFAKPQIYLFDGFINELLKEWGVFRQPILPAEQKFILRMVTRNLLEKGVLAFLHKMANYDGFYLSVLNWLNEIKGNGVTPKEWFENHQNSQKDKDLGLIYQQYDEYLRNFNMVDIYDNYIMAINGIDNGGIFANKFPDNRILQTPSLKQKSQMINSLKIVVIDSFYKLNQLQLLVIQKLIQRNVQILAYAFGDEKRSESFSSAVELFNQLKCLADREGCILEIEKENTQMTNKPLEHLKNYLFDLSAPQINGDKSISIFHTPDVYQEIEMIGRQIKKAVLQRPDLKLGQIGIILRDPGDYKYFIREIMDELKIPYQISEGISLNRSPIFKLILNIYNIFNQNWSRERVLEVIKSQYLGINDLFPGEFEKIILEAGIIKGQTNWSAKLERYQKTLESVNNGVTAIDKQTVSRLKETLDKIIKDLDILQKKQSLISHCQGLLEFLKKYHLAEQISVTPDSEILRRDLLSLKEIQQVLTRLVRFGTILDQYHPERINLTYSEFIQFLTDSVERIQLPEVKLDIDAVEVITPSQSRGKRFKLVFVSGLVEGGFPRYGKNDWLFSSEEKQALKAHGLNFKHHYEMLEEERLFFLQAISTAAEELILTSPVWETDETAQKSSFIQEVLNLFNKGTIQQQEIIQVYEKDLIPLTRRELDEGLLSELWSNENIHNPNLIIEEYIYNQQSIGDTFTKELIRIENYLFRGQMVRCRESEKFSEYDGFLNNEEIRKVLKTNFSYERIYSVSQINDYATCPFLFFCKQVLKLDQIKEPILRLEALDLGILYHRILYKFFKDFAGWDIETLENSLTRLHSVAKEIIAKFSPGKNLPSGLWAVYQEEIINYLDRILVFEYAEATRQNYQMHPKWLEISFGPGDRFMEEEQKIQKTSYEPVVFSRQSSDGEVGEVQIKFGGKIDRIDLSKDGNFLIIYDYKLGGRDGLKNMEAGFDLQLPVYIKAAKSICGQEKVILGAGYFSIKDCNRESGIWKMEREDLIPVTSRKKNCLTDREWETLLGQIEGFIFQYLDSIRSGDFRVNPAKECPQYCEFKKICRYEPSRIGLKISTNRLNGGAADEI